MEFCHLELKLSGCSKELVDLDSDRYTQVRLYSIQPGTSSQSERLIRVVGAAGSLRVRLKPYKLLDGWVG